MSSDHEAEIRASVAAYRDLGPRYDEAVAEGLVERIGAEIDKRIDARLGHGEQPASGMAGAPPGPGPGPWARPSATPGPAAPAEAAGPDRSMTPGGYQAPAGYQMPPGYQGYQGPMLPPGYQPGPPPAKPSSIEQRNVATTITALGSIALGVAATAITSGSSNPGAQVIMVLLIWVAIAVINVAYARRH